MNAVLFFEFSVDTEKKSISFSKGICSKSWFGLGCMNKA
jgi:hypothetical protein